MRVRPYSPRPITSSLISVSGPSNQSSKVAYLDAVRAFWILVGVACESKGECGRGYTAAFFEPRKVSLCAERRRHDWEQGFAIHRKLVNMIGGPIVTSARNSLKQLEPLGLNGTEKHP